MQKLALSFLLLYLNLNFSFPQSLENSGKGKAVLSNSKDYGFSSDSAKLYHLKTVALYKLEIPKPNPKDYIISHTAYSLLYNEAHEQANWVAYELTKEETVKQYERSNKFVIDPKVLTGSANNNDYKGSGYDRGHLAPASDMGFSEISMKESFYYSNMSPQEASFNRGIWKKLEELVRTWAVENDKIYVVTGPILTSGLQTIGANKVSVPRYYYKVILDYTEPGIKGIGFILPNAASSSPLQNYAVSIDSVEKFSKIDFFPSLPDDQEKLIEKTLCLNCWSWKSAKVTAKKNKGALSVQCKGTTKKGENCKNKTLSPSGYCHFHEGQANDNGTIAPNASTKSSSSSVQCSGITKSGQRCKRMTKNYNGRCYQH